MDAHLPIAIFEFDTVKCVVDIFASGRIDGENGEMAEIDSTGL
jgi:hypothetical protein